MASGRVTVHDIDGGASSIGRAPENDVVISDRVIARHHGRFHVRGDQVVYEHLRSRSPSAVWRAGELLLVNHEAGFRVVLQRGDELVLGGSPGAARVRVDLPEESGAPGDRSDETVYVELSLGASSPGTVSELAGNLERSALVALYHYASETMRERDTGEIIRVFAKRIFDAFGEANHLEVFLRDAPSTRFEPFLAFDRNGAAESRPLSRSLLDLVSESGDAVLFHAGEMPVAASDSLRIAAVRSGLCAPLWHGERLIGLVQVDCRGGLANRFSEQDLKLLVVFTHQLALTLESTALTEKLRVTVSQLQEAKEDMERLAFTDPLTGLPNRRLFFDRLDQATRRMQRSGVGFAVMYLDMDRLKEINDSFGHEVGDRAISAVGRRILTCVRAQDTVGRLGGDEFAVLLADVESDGGVTKVADKIRRELKRPLLFPGRPGGEPAAHPTLTVSIGYAMAPRDGTSSQALLQTADRGLYRAKASARERSARKRSG